MADGEEESRKVIYPVDTNSYKLLDEIGRGASAIVYKAICYPVNNCVIAIKSIDLDQSRADFDNVRREAKTMSLLSHPNILNAHCCFTVNRFLWVVMPFMSAGSLQSIIEASFPDGLPEPCISIVLKETLHALLYLHDQGHVHRDVKAGNILVDSNGVVKLADFGVSASIYEPHITTTHGHGSSSRFPSSSSSSSSSLMFTDVAGTPYWMAPEVIHSHTGYSFKADIWSFGITALELAHGRPPLSNLPPSKSMLMKITKRFRFSDYENCNNNKNKKFSKAFRDMVCLCLDQDPSKRPSADKLLKHSFFKNCKGQEFLVKNVLQGLPSVEQRFKEAKIKRQLSSMHTSDDDDNKEDDHDFSDETNVKQRRISGWNFNFEGFEMDPVFPVEKENSNIGKQVPFSGITTIQEKTGAEAGEDQSNVSSVSSPGQVENEAQVLPRQFHEAFNNVENLASDVGCGSGINREAILGSLLFLKKSNEDQRQDLMNIISFLGGGGGGGEVIMEMNREEQLMQMIENLRIELENEKRKNYALEIELHFLKLQTSNGNRKDYALD